MAPATHLVRSDGKGIARGSHSVSRVLADSGIVHRILEPGDHVGHRLTKSVECVRDRRPIVRALLLRVQLQLERKRFDLIPDFGPSIFGSGHVHIVRHAAGAPKSRTTWSSAIGEGTLLDYGLPDESHGTVVDESKRRRGVGRVEASSRRRSSTFWLLGERRMEDEDDLRVAPMRRSSAANAYEVERDVAARDFLITALTTWVIRHSVRRGMHPFVRADYPGSGPGSSAQKFSGRR